MSYSVSRQCRWPDNRLTVVVSQDLPTTLDLLHVKYAHEGEGERYDDPVDAVEAAIRVATAWRKTEPAIYVACGGEAGFTEPFGVASEIQLIAWARNIRPRCAECMGEIKREPIEVEDPDTGEDEVVCSLSCEDAYYERVDVDDEPDDAHWDEDSEDSETEADE